MIIRRTNLYLCLILATALIFTSCASPAAPPQPAAPAETSAPAQSEASPLLTKEDGWVGPALTKDKITLRVLRQIYANDAEEQYFKDTQAEFTKAYPNITFEEETVPFSQLFQKVLSTASMDSPPDITLGMSDFVPEYVYNKMPIALDQYLTKEYLDDILPSVRSMSSVDGKLYMMPYETQPSGWTFNRAIWKEAGVATPPETTDVNAGWTYEQHTEAWKKLSKDTNGDGEPDIYGYCSSFYGAGGPGSNYWYEGVIIRGYGDKTAPKDSSAYKTFQAVSDDGLTTTGYIDTPEAEKAMKVYQSWFKEKLTPMVNVPNQFPDETAAECMGHTFWISWYPDWAKTADLGYTPWPKGNMVFTHSSGAGFYVSSKSKYPAEAAAYLAYIHNNANRVRWFKVWPNAPARASLFPLMEGYDKMPWSMNENILKESYAPPLTPAGVEYQTAMNSAIKDIANGADVAARLKQAAQEIDGILAGYK
jgi:multiple sugar transport system substrate-binding protein